MLMLLEARVTIPMTVAHGIRELVPQVIPEPRAHMPSSMRRHRVGIRPNRATLQIQPSLRHLQGMWLHTEQDTQLRRQDMASPLKILHTISSAQTCVQVPSL